MATDNFNKPLKLINKKPNGSQMIDSGYGFYMYPSLVVEYSNKALTDRERRLYFAISGQAEKDKNGKPYFWAMKHYCQIANINSNHYSEVLQGLCKKGFIIHNNFESIEVLYPISENEIISSNGQIITKQDSKIGKNAQKEINIQKVQDSQNGKSASNNEQDSILLKKEEESQKGNQEDKIGKSDSQDWANNREIKKIKNIYREEDSYQMQKEIEEEKQKEENYRRKALIIIKQIGAKFNIENEVLKQFEELQKRYSNKYIYYGLKYKGIESFSMGIGLLFKEDYHYEISQYIMEIEELIETEWSSSFLSEMIKEEKKKSFVDLI